MRYLCAALCCVLVLLLYQDISAQDSTRVMQRFRVLLKTGERIEGKNGVLSPASLEGTTKAGTTLNIQRSSIRALDVYAGSNMAKWGAVGAGLGLVTGLLAIIQVSADSDATLNEGAAVGVTAGLTIGGGLIGLLAGSRDSRWESVPLKTATLIDPETGQVMLMARLTF